MSTLSLSSVRKKTPVRHLKYTYQPPRPTTSTGDNLARPGAPTTTVGSNAPAGPPPPLSWRRTSSTAQASAPTGATGVTGAATASPRTHRESPTQQQHSSSSSSPRGGSPAGAHSANDVVTVGGGRSGTLVDVKGGEAVDVCFPGWHESQLASMNGAEANVLGIDVESVNPSRGPLRVCAFVLMAYRKLLTYEIIDRVQFIVERSPDEYDADGRIFWKEKAIGIDRYFDHPSTFRLPPAKAAACIRAYLDHCWATVPSLAILVDEPQTDHALLYEFLKQHGHRPLCSDANGHYKRNIHVSRDLMRGAYSMIDARFINLTESDMYVCINNYWHALVQKHAQDASQRHHRPDHPDQRDHLHQVDHVDQQQSGSGYAGRDDYNTVAGPEPAEAFASGGLPSMSICKSSAVVALNAQCVFRTQIGPDLKHVPVFDATQSLLLWAKMEDIKRLFHVQLVKIAMTAPSLLLLPKPGFHAFK